MGRGHTWFYLRKVVHLFVIKIVRALHICAHSVAVANLCSKLPEFIAWLKKSKKTPNLTNMGEATMPKGREQKLSQREEVYGCNGKII